MSATENLRAWTEQALNGDPAAYDGPNLQDVIAVVSRSETAEKWMTLYEAAIIERDQLREALRIARPWVEQEWGTGDWQRELEAAQDLIDGALGDKA